MSHKRLQDRKLLLSSIHDITERVRDEKRLAEVGRELEEQGRRLAANRDFVSAILDSVASHLAILDADGTIVDENSPWRMFAHGNGMPAGWTAVGVNYLAVCRAAQGAERDLALAAAEGIEDVVSGRRNEFVLRYPCDAPDRKRWFQMRVTPLTGGQGRVVVSHDDISDLILAEATLMKSEANLRAILDNSPYLTWLKDTEGRYITINKTFADYLRLQGVQRVVGMTDLDLQPKELAEKYRADDAEVMALRRQKHIEETAFDGNRFHWVETFKTPIIDAHGDVLGTVGFACDITDRKQIELRLSELLDLNQKIINECPVGIVAYKTSGECVLANDAYARIMGGTLDDVRSSNFLESQMWKETGLLESALAALATRDLRQASAHHITSFGREVWADVFFVPFASGGEPHLLCIKNDITEQTRTNEQLAVARDRAEAASRAKSEFVANMSHEIRTPMNAIMGLSRLLEDSSLGERERDYVAKIQLSAQSLLAILNDILDFSKIEAGRLELEHTAFALDGVLRNLSAIVSTNARDKGLETIFSVAPDVPTGLVGDPLRLQQVLLNLMGNAVKFTLRGEVMLSIRKADEDQAAVTLEFSVKDTGIGIPSDQRDGLFKAFSQADSSTSRRYGGTGLGLTISSRLVALMGGTITLTSEPGRGSDFRFTARFGRAADGAAGQPSSIGLENLTVLVVDDNQTARQVLVHTCQSFRWRTEAAASAEAGLDLLRRYTADGQDLDILLLDWQMPEIDGIEMLKRARADPAIRLPLVILMVTAFGSENVAHAADGVHINAILAKPTTPSAILDAVAAVHRGVSVNDVASMLRPLSGRLLGLRVLLVEDNEINQQVAHDLLVRVGASVAIVGDGRAAVDLLETQADRFDAVLMDVQMPEMDGYEATRIIRTRLGLTALPIIAMTANALETDRQKSMQAGMNAHLAKPIDVEEMIATLTAQASAPGRHGSAPPLPADAGLPPDQTELPLQVPGIDLKSVLIRLGGDRHMLVSLLGNFEGSQGRAVADVRRLLAQGTAGEAANILHRLRGVAANIGAVDVARLASEAEIAVKGRRDVEVPDLLADLEAAMAVVIETAQTLAPPISVVPDAATVDLGTLRDGLERLLVLLRNSDLKAVDEFRALRPAIEAAVDRAVAQELAESIDRLDFAAAEERIKGCRWPGP